MHRILIRHTSGIRANQVDDFPAQDFREIVAGRDQAATVRFDPDREDLVSRQHARIYPDPQHSGELLINDMQSRNGTFLNRQRIQVASRIHHGDVVQLGPGGPEFRVELDPPPASAARATRLAGAGSSIAVRPTRVSGSLDAPRPIGRATVERMLDDTFGKVKRESGKTLWAGVAAVIMIAVVGAGAYWYMHRSSVENAKRLQDQQLLLLQMAQVIRQQPANDAAVRAQVEKLGGDLKRVMAENAVLARTAQSPGMQSNSDYDAGLAQATNLYKANQFQQAYAECVRISQIDPSRWEGFYIAGLSAEALNSPQDAQQDYQYALAQAPENAKATITQHLSALQSAAPQAN
ncbi:MAG TPA: FHA domain-containing protein [Terracidiphilus sp.]|nr:FHA domain-containing protein [Terracidiphilus sp.]